MPRLPQRGWRRVGDPAAFSGPERQPRRRRGVWSHARGARRSGRSGRDRCCSTSRPIASATPEARAFSPVPSKSRRSPSGCGISRRYPRTPSRRPAIGSRRRVRRPRANSCSGGSRTVSTTTPCAISSAITAVRRIGFRRRISSTVSGTSCARRACRRCSPRPTASAAEKLALNAFRAGDVNGLVPCKPSTARDVKCRDQFVRTFGLRAFRRPLDRRRIPAIRDAVHVAGREDRPVPRRRAHRRRGDAAVAEVSFSRRRPPSTRRRVVERLRNREPALVHALGHDAGRAAVRRGGEGRAANPRRSRSRGEDACSTSRRRGRRSTSSSPSGSDSIACWARSRIAADYPEFTPELAAMMVQETRLLLGHLVWNDGNFMEAFTADYSFLNSDLAGCTDCRRPPASSSSSGSRRPRTAPGCSARHRSSRRMPDRSRPHRPRAAFSSANSCSASTCRIRRPGVNTQVPEPTIDKPLAKRQRMQAHVDEPDVRDLSSADGSDRLRPGKLRRDRPVARPGNHRVREHPAQYAAEESRRAD